MAEEAISTYYPNLRAVLSDSGSNGIYQWKDEQLDGFLRTVVQTGLGPAGVTVKAGDPTMLDPAPASADARGYMIFQAALLAMGGRIMIGFQTRPMKVTVNAEERKLTVDHLRRLIQRLEKHGDPHGTGKPTCFGVWADLENYVSRMTEPDRLV